MATNSFNHIYALYYRKACLFAKSYVHDDLVSEDIASEALVRLWRRMKEEEITYVRPLLLTILRNKSLDYLKHEEVKRNVFDTLTNWNEQDQGIQFASCKACDPNELFSDEVACILYNTLSTLPKQTQRVFEMLRLEEKSYKEIAAISGISVKGVEYHIGKATRQLRVALKDYL